MVEQLIGAVLRLRNLAFGRCFNPVLITCDEYRKYREFIPHYDDWIWTATPWYCGGKDSDTGNANAVRIVYMEGKLSSSNSVVPACILNPEFLNLRKDMAYVEDVSE